MSSKRNDPRLSRKYKEVRLKALARDGYVCYYCGAEDKDMTIDHIIPVSKAPEMAIDINNMITACKPCNSRKGKRSQGVFLARNSTPPAFPSNISPITTSTVLAGPCTGQPEQN